jgi:tRNA pseudouridine13 synthase
MVLMKTSRSQQCYDSRIGIESYSTDFEGIGGRIKDRYQDFKVEELISPEIFSTISEKPTVDRKYPIFRLVKEGVDTIHAMRQIRNHLGWNAHYLGLKDKQAQTIQYISPKQFKKEIPKKIQVTTRISLDLCGYYSKRLTRKNLVGNQFSIKISNIESNLEHVKKSIAELKHFINDFRIPNFYGYQRFGNNKPHNHLIGRAIVKRQFKEAVIFILEHIKCEDKKTSLSKEDIEDSTNYPSIIKKINQKQDTEKQVLISLIDRPNNWISALRVVPIAIRRFFINAYQAYIFNRVMSIAVDRDLDLGEVDIGDIYGTVNDEGNISDIRRAKSRVISGNTKKILPMVQLVGYAFRGCTGRFDQITKNILDEEGISHKLFYNNQMSELSMEGGFRTPPLLVNDLEIRTHSKDKSSISLQFTLQKGSYATVLLRELIKPSDPISAGF